MGKQIIRRSVLVLVLAIVSTGCIFSKLDEDLAKLQSPAHLFAGEVSIEGTKGNAIVVVALNDRKAEKIVSFRMMSGPGPFEIRSEAKPTFFFAFDDMNRDLKFQANEAYGWAAQGKPLNPSIQATDNIDFAINSAADDLLTYPPRLVDEPLENHLNNYVRVNLGTVSSLDNPWFSDELAKKGLWQPFAFVEGGGTGIHFLEPYDPDKVPVLFVHGINDTPRRFVELIDHLDRSKFQAWVLSYPSGLRLSWLARGMYQFLGVLHSQYRFDEMHVVAYSMGGLVSRGSLNLCAQNDSCKYLRSYTTLSTPWNGVASAKNGVKWAPTVVPVWHDLDPASEYITTLFDTPLPDGLPYHLMFGFRHDALFGSESSDGVVKLKSQLRDEAQEQAKTIRGHDEDHVSIVSSETVGGMLNEILEQRSQ